MGATSYARRFFLQKLFRDQRVYVSLHTQAPGDQGASEVSGGGYRRQQVTFTFVPDSLDVMNSEQITFADMPATRILGTAAWDAERGGRCLWIFEPLEAKNTNADDVLTIDGGLLVAAVGD